jgi:hypothetical protein
VPDPEFRRVTKAQLTAQEYRDLRRRSDLSPIVLPAIHVPYTGFACQGWEAAAEGFCYTVNFDNQEFCAAGGNREKLREGLWYCDPGSRWINVPGADRAQREYHEELDRMDYLFTKRQIGLLRFGLAQCADKELDRTTWLARRQLAVNGV